MNAGKGLDALVAERVMGHVWDESRCRVCGWPLAASRDDGCVAGDCSMRPPPARRADEPAPYSTDIAAAWQVVEHFTDVIIEKAGGNYRATVSSTFEADADTPWRAICLSALKAVGCGVSDPVKKTHALLAKGIVDMHRLHPGKYDLGAQIEGVLEYVRGDERAFWRDAIEGAIAICEQQDKREAAAVLQALLDSEAAQ